MQSRGPWTPRICTHNDKEETRMSGNRGVVYLGPGKVEVQNIPYPKMQDPQGRQIDHG